MSSPISIRRTNPQSRGTAHLSCSTGRLSTTVCLHFIDSLSQTVNLLPEYWYTFKYPELSPRGGAEHPWSIRQTAIYHQIRLSDRRSTYILISPRGQSPAEEKLCEWMTNIRSRRDAEEQAFVAHDLVTSVYTSSWRPYLLHYEIQLQELVRSEATLIRLPRNIEN